MTKVTDAELQELFRGQTGGSDRQSCPSSEVLTAMSRDELDGEERRRVVAHLAECSDCSLELRMARSLEPWAEDLAERLSGEEVPHDMPPPVPVAARRRRRTEGRRSTRRHWMPAAVAAALALAAVSAYLLVPADPVAEAPTDVRRGVAVDGLHPFDDAVVERPPERLAWAAQLGATHYRVRLFDARAELLWESEALEAGEVSLPPEALRLLESPGSYSWTVEVEGSARRSRLGPFSFRVAPSDR